MTYAVDQLRAHGVPEPQLDIRAWRKQHGITLLELSCEAYMSLDQLWRYEMGHTRPKPSTLARLQSSMARLEKIAGRMRIEPKRKRRQRCR